MKQLLPPPAFRGGNYLSAHEWRDAIGDPDKRPPRLDPVRNGFQPNDVGTDEFMILVELLGVHPFISVNAGFGDAWSAAQLVEYANGAATTPMGRQRAANGHTAPYHIEVRILETALTATPETLTVAPISIEIYEFEKL